MKPAFFASAAFALSMFAAPALAQTADGRTAEAVARAALDAAPVWDGHNDLPIQLRGRRGNVLAEFDLEHTHDEPAFAGREPSALHTDLPRLREGMVGAQWWSVFRERKPARARGGASHDRAD